MDGCGSVMLFLVEFNIHFYCLVSFENYYERD